MAFEFPSNANSSDFLDGGSNGGCGCDFLFAPLVRQYFDGFTQAHDREANAISSSC